jgi:hypothetical protein
LRLPRPAAIAPETRKGVKPKRRMKDAYASPPEVKPKAAAAQ